MLNNTPDVRTAFAASARGAPESAFEDSTCETARLGHAERERDQPIDDAEGRDRRGTADHLMRGIHDVHDAPSGHAGKEGRAPEFRERRWRDARRTDALRDRAAQKQELD